jgi:serine phosphatase RsbU (regulator of sigma subunit)
MKESKPVILCVDDESIILDSLNFLFRNSFEDKYSVEFAESGAEAIELIEELLEENREIAIIVSDYLMPGMKGDEFLINAHKILPNTKKILLTGQADFRAVTNTINSANLYRFISKPWQNEDITLTISEAIKSYFQDKLLEVQNKQLEEKNIELEEKVKERTKLLNTSLDTIRRDLQIAKKIQESTLTYHLEPSLKLNICTTYIPMTEVGGDFFNISNSFDGIVRILLADATGHGVQAALITMAIRGIYDTIKDTEKELSNVVKLLNIKFIEKYGTLNTFFTGIVVDIDTINKSFRYASFGHPPCVFIKDNNICLLEKTGRMIGINKTSEYRVNEISYVEGSSIFLYTDGIFEQFNENREEFGEEKVNSVLLENINLGLEENLNDLLGRLDLFLEGGEKQDDITLIGINFLK